MLLFRSESLGFIFWTPLLLRMPYLLAPAACPVLPHHNIKYPWNPQREMLKVLQFPLFVSSLWSQVCRTLFQDVWESSEHRMLIVLCQCFGRPQMSCEKLMEPALQRLPQGKKTEIQTDVTVMSRNKRVETA